LASAARRASSCSSVPRSRIDSPHQLRGLLCGEGDEPQRRPRS
jgi:hypothetical protein